MDQKIDQKMDQPVESAEEYYNSHRKRSFLFSRIGIITSLVILVGVLAFNITTLYTNKTTVRSNASEYPNTNNLPKLPKDCAYKPIKNGYEVVCVTGSTNSLSQPGQPVSSAQVPNLPHCTAIMQLVDTPDCAKDKQKMQSLPTPKQECKYKINGQDQIVPCHHSLF